jgi:hypothetical protein
MADKDKEKDKEKVKDKVNDKDKDEDKDEDNNNNNNNNRQEIVKAFAFGNEPCSLDIDQPERHPDNFLITRFSIFTKEQWKEYIGYEGPFPALGDFFYFGPFHRSEEKCIVIAAPSKYWATDPNTGQRFPPGQPTGYKTLTDEFFLQHADFMDLDEEQEYAPVLRGDPLNRDGVYSYAVEDRDYFFSYGVLKRYRLFIRGGGGYDNDGDIPYKYRQQSRSDAELYAEELRNLRHEEKMYFHSNERLYNSIPPYRPPRNANV